MDLYAYFIHLFIHFSVHFVIRAIAPRLTIYVSFDGSSYHAIYLHANTAIELIQKIVKLPGFTDCLANASANVENNMFSGWSKFQIQKFY